MADPMKTDWKQIRELLNTAVDACETIEELGITESDRSRTIEIPGAGEVTVFDFLQSAWTYPENQTYAVVRERHDHGMDKPYTPESARILVNVARLCAELVDGGNKGSLEKITGDLNSWYQKHMIPGLRKAFG